MATPALAPIKPRAAVPRTSLTHFIEVDDWVVEELESTWKKMARKVNNLFRNARSKGDPRELRQHKQFTQGASEVFSPSTDSGPLRALALFVDPSASFRESITNGGLP